MHKLMKFMAKSSTFATAYLALTGVAHATSTTGDNIVDVKPDIGSTTVTDAASGRTYINNLVGGILNVVGFLAGAIALVYLIWSGIQYITAGSDTKKAEGARQGILHAVIGIIIIIAAYVILNLAVGAGNGIANPDQFK